MKLKSLLYVVIVVGMLASFIVVPVVASEDDVAMYVSRVRLAWTGRSSGGTDAVVGMVHVRDANQAAVAGATVTVEWTLPDGTVVTETAVTDDLSGIATFRIWAGGGEYALCVAGVTKEGWTYDPSLDEQTCADLDLWDVPHY